MIIAVHAGEERRNFPQISKHLGKIRIFRATTKKYLAKPNSMLRHRCGDHAQSGRKRGRVVKAPDS